MLPFSALFCQYLQELICYRGSPHFVIFGTKRESRNSKITNCGTLFSIKTQIESKRFLKSPFLANFHEISVVENQNTIVRLILKCLLSSFITFFNLSIFFKSRIHLHKMAITVTHSPVLSLNQSSKKISDNFLFIFVSLKLLIVLPKTF